MNFFIVRVGLVIFFIFFSMQKLLGGDIGVPHQEMSDVASSIRDCSFHNIGREFFDDMMVQKKVGDICSRPWVCTLLRQMDIDPNAHPVWTEVDKFFSGYAA